MMTNHGYSEYSDETGLEKLAHTAAPDLAEQFFKYIRLTPDASYIPIPPEKARDILAFSATPDLAELFFQPVSSD